MENDMKKLHEAIEETKAKFAGVTRMQDGQEYRQEASTDIDGIKDKDYRKFVVSAIDAIAKAGVPREAISFRKKGCLEEWDCLVVNTPIQNGWTKPPVIEIGRVYAGLQEKAQRAIKGSLQNLQATMKDEMEAAADMHDGIDFSDYGSYKDRLCLRCFRTSWMDAKPYGLPWKRQDAITREIGDISVAVCVLVDQGYGAPGFLCVPRSCLKTAGKTAEEVLRDAAANTMDTEALFRLNVSAGGGDAPQYIVVSNMYKCWGAAMAFVPDVIRGISESFDDDVLIAFTSINEAILHKASSTDPKEIRGAILYTYKDAEVPADERLSEKVYRYSRKTGRYSVEIG